MNFNDVKVKIKLKALTPGAVNGDFTASEKKIFSEQWRKLIHIRLLPEKCLMTGLSQERQ